MAYSDIALLGNDSEFLARCAAAYSVETLGQPGSDPSQWIAEHSWQMASQPGFGDAYASALASDNPRPGNDPAVVTDPQILSAVQAVVAAGSTA